MQTFQRNNTGGQKYDRSPTAEALSDPHSRDLAPDASVTSETLLPPRPANAPSGAAVRHPRLAAVVPAHNEERRIGKVIETLLAVPEIHQVVVVNDGSTDTTAEVIRAYGNDIVFVDLTVNQGKGGAMLQGVRAAADAEVVLFLDADLIGLTCEHVRALAAPVTCGDADMTVGQFRAGRGLTDLAQFIASSISGQRAIRRSLFLEIPDLDQVGYGIEMAITWYVKRKRGAVEMVTLRGVTHPMKEEKLGFARGAKARLRMYSQMLKFALKSRTGRRDKF